MGYNTVKLNRIYGSEEYMIKVIPSPAHAQRSIQNRWDLVGLALYDVIG